MIESVTLKNFRGLSELTVPLSKVTMLTGVNGIGKTSVLEGLYCLFSHTRLDVGPLTRNDRGIGVEFNQGAMGVSGIITHQTYNYKQFWTECPTFGSDSCLISANDGLVKWEWAYKKVDMGGLEKLSQELANFSSPTAKLDNTSEFALWKWTVAGKTFDKAHNPIKVNEKSERFQPLTPDGNLNLFPKKYNFPTSVGIYLDFPVLRSNPQSLPFEVSQRLVEALKLINPNVTDVRKRGEFEGLSVVIDNKYEMSIGCLGNGAVTWASALLAMFSALENIKIADLNHFKSPYFLLVDEIGAGIHYSVMLRMWKYIYEFLKEYPYVSFVTTSHNDDCIRAFCEVFSPTTDIAKVVRLHKTASDQKIRTTEYNSDQFDKIISGDWEVRG